MVIIHKNTEAKNVTSKSQKCVLGLIGVASLVKLDFKLLKGRAKTYFISNSLRKKLETKQVLTKCLFNSIAFQGGLRWNPQSMTHQKDQLWKIL